MNAPQAERYRQIPAVEKLLTSPAGESLLAEYPRASVADALRDVLAERRAQIGAGEEVDLTPTSLVAAAAARLRCRFEPRLKRVINATGTVIHTNLGRALLGPAVVERMTLAATRYVNLEYDLEGGERGHRDNLTESLLCELTGAEAATVVNNNAAAALLCLNTMAAGREVIVSRGELIEIGGAFRLPDVMERSGAILREVGTTNRTHLRDYRNAINENTALLLKVHPSNYAILGFTQSVSHAEIVALGREFGIPTMEDLGSGALVDLTAYGLPREPVVRDRVAAGLDVVIFSGDKLLGGPQAGIIVGKKEWIDRFRKNPLMRALRLSKLIIAALEATLRLYLHPETLLENLPHLRYLARPLADLEALSERVAAALQAVFGERATVTVEDGASQVGSGALPLETLPSKHVLIAPREHSVEALAGAFRSAPVPVIGRVREDRFILDLRTVSEEEAEEIVAAARTVVGDRVTG